MKTACVLGINSEPVTIKDNEYTIIERAYEEGWVVANMPKKRLGKTVAVIGSGPSGLSAADQLNQFGYTVTVFERSDRIGGLLMYGIPNMKLNKKVVEKRNAIMAEEGIIFKPNTNIGVDIDITQIVDEYDAVLLAIGLHGQETCPWKGEAYLVFILQWIFLLKILKGYSITILLKIRISVQRIKKLL